MRSESNWFTKSRISFTAPTKLVPLSLVTSDGTPRRLVKRVKQFRKLSVSSAQAISKWIALVARHVNKHNHRFCRCLPSTLNRDKGSRIVHSALVKWTIGKPKTNFGQWGQSAFFHFGWRVIIRNSWPVVFVLQQSVGTIPP